MCEKIERKTEFKRGRILPGKRRDTQNTKGTDAEQQSVESQENYDVSKTINLPTSLKIYVVAEDVVAQQSIHKDSFISDSPQHSIGPALLEINLEAPIHLSTILEDVEITAEGVEASEATESISHSILHTEADDKVQKLVQDPTAIEESNDGKETHVYKAMLDLEDDLFFLEDMPMHEIQKQISPIVARQTAIEASQAKLEAHQAQTEKIDESKCKQLSLICTDDENPDGGNKGEQKESKRGSKRNERRVEELAVPTKMQKSSQVTPVADEDQGILEKEAGAEASQYLQTLKVKGRKTTLFYKDPKIQLFDSETTNVDIAVVSQVLYEDDTSNRPTRGIVKREISQAEDERSLRSQAIGTADMKLKGNEKIEEKSRISKFKAKAEIYMGLGPVGGIFEQVMKEDALVQDHEVINKVDEDQVINANANIVVNNEENDAVFQDAIELNEEGVEADVIGY
ncbi:hypothetical protein AgCh_030620 [Apium graveolens]